MSKSSGDRFELTQVNPSETDTTLAEYGGETEPLTGSDPAKRLTTTIVDETNGYSDLPKVPVNYEHIEQNDPQDTIRSVHFQRSQSLPHITSDENLRRKLSNRTRFMSGHALHRMRNVSRRFSTIGEHDENQERGNWDNPIEFFLSCLGYAVGLGNVWRFPYLCYKNGGGAFLIPYGIMLFGCGLPLMLLELALGQFSSEGPLTVWKVSPMFKGIGIGMVMCSIICAVYYNMITGWALYYLFHSIREHLPWSCCDAEWATENCVSFAQAGVCAANNNTISSSLNRSTSHLWGANSTAKFAADEYFHHRVLNIGEGFHDDRGLQWELVLALGVAWLIVFAVLTRGIKSVGKTVYFTSTFPYLVLFALLINAATKDGAVDGILFYLTPKWEKLLEAKVWGDAASQIFYSTGVCMGGTITLASYNRFHNNLYRDAIIVALGNSLTSIFSGFVVFSILGFMAHSQNTTVDKIVTGGPGLTFITYPQAVVLFPASPVWSALFFVMLLTLALSTMFPSTENISTSIIDQFPQLLRPYKFWVTMATCIVLFLLGLPLCTGAGLYVLQLMDNYGVGYALLILGLVEIMVCAWRYGADRVLNDIKMMIGYRPSNVWLIIWKYITPGLLVFSISFTFSQLKPLDYDYTGYVYPPWADALGWCLTSLSLGPIVIYAIYYLIRRQLCVDDPQGATGIYKLKNALIRGTEANETEWGPALMQYRFAGTEVKEHEDDVFA